MSAEATVAAPDPGDRAGERRHRGRASTGASFALLFIAGIVPLGDLLGSFGDSDRTFVDYFEKDSNRVGTLVGGLVLGLAALCFLWFLSHLRLAMSNDGSPPGIVTAAGTTFAVLLMIGAAALITVPHARTFGDAYGEADILAGNEALLAQLGYVLVAVFAMWTFAVLIIAVTVDGRRSGTFPRWLVRVGFASAAFVVVLGSTVMGILGVPFWVLCVSMHWGREERRKSSTALTVS